MVGKKKNILVIWFIVLTFLIGIFYMIMVVNTDVPDATSHFWTSYTWANKLLGLETTNYQDDLRGLRTKNTNKITIRDCDICLFDLENDYNIKGFGFIESYEYISYDTEAYSYSPFPTYIVDAAAIAIGMKIRLAPYTLLYLVRIVNLIAYIAVGVLAIKIIPIGKEFMAVVFLLPAGIQRASATSHESLYYAFAWFYIAFVLHLAYADKKIKNKDILLLLIFSMLLAPVKGLGIGYVLLILLIGKNKFENNKKYWLVILGCLFLSGIMWLSLNLLINHSGNLWSSANGQHYIEYSGTYGVTVVDILSSPFHYIKIIMMTFITYYTNFMGAMVGIYGISIGGTEWLFAYAFATIFIFAALSDENEVHIPRKGRLIIGGVYLFIYVLLCMLTVIMIMGADTSLGKIKVSYVMPFLPLLGFMLKGDFVTYNRKNKTQVVMIMETVVHILSAMFAVYIS